MHGKKMEDVMIFELAWTYIPVVVIGLFWAVAMRPLLRLNRQAMVTPGARAHSGRRAPAGQRRG
jgi:hypothetical protein